MKSDGGSTPELYNIPEGCVGCEDIIVAKDMNWFRANIFKAVWRWGGKDGTDLEYDINKIEHNLNKMKDLAGIPRPRNVEAATNTEVVTSNEEIVFQAYRVAPEPYHLPGCNVFRSGGAACDCGAA